MGVLFNVEFLPLRENAFDESDVSSYAVKLSVRGSISMENSPEIDMLIKTLCDGRVRKFILNLEHLSYIDSTGIGSIIRAKKNLASLSGDIVLLNVPPKIKEAFDLVNLNDFMTSCYSERKALEHLADQA
ncbi:MAG: STAS domain-containing protein [Spirochaetes bacterium]|nr:STAS domain-containing protein [Spirochaetota bacterium]